MISDRVKKGPDKTPHRSLFKAMGYTDEELSRPLIGVVNAQNEIIPGHIHLDILQRLLRQVFLQLVVLLLKYLQSVYVTVLQWVTLVCTILSQQEN